MAARWCPRTMVSVPHTGEGTMRCLSTDDIALKRDGFQYDQGRTIQAVGFRGAHGRRWPIGAGEGSAVVSGKGSSPSSPIPATPSLPRKSFCCRPSWPTQSPGREDGPSLAVKSIISVDAARGRPVQHLRTRPSPGSDHASTPCCRRDRLRHNGSASGNYWQGRVSLLEE